ncbi:family 20 glycosylhydrolase [Streptomyces sp. NPDC051582]|uniref:family 20 glycosylhydrolase n=1 Tax=Streptomyces sp. NPDC051582 TaxID=3155167 RepID=UPI003428ADB0
MASVPTCAPAGKGPRFPLVRRLAGFAGAALVVTGLSVPGAAPARGETAAIAATAAPRTVPALQQWAPSPGGFVLTSAARILIDPVYTAQLGDEGRQLAADLRELTAVDAPVKAAAPGHARTGDIVLTLGSTDPQLGEEGYSLTSATVLTVRGRTDTGVFHGTRTLLQLLHQSPAIPGGTARDWPDKVERGLMVDVGRKYFTVDWLQEQIREMAHLKLNYLHLHLSDDQGFRIESAGHPEIVSAQHYSKREITDLIAYASRFHVMVVPEIDAPGHMAPVIAAHPELQLKDTLGRAADGRIDLSLPAARRMVDDLVTEYLPLFPAPYWHTGADEYVTDYQRYPQLLAYAREQYGSGAKAVDTYYGFINHVDELVRAAGKTTRIWTDGIKGDGTVEPAPGILGEKWNSSGLSAQTLIARGHTVTNEARSWLYYVLGRYKPPTAALYESWRPDTFDDGTTVTEATRNRGAKLHIWCDTPSAETEEQVAAGVAKALRVLAQQTWGSPKPTATFAEFLPVIGAAGRAPGNPPLAVPGNLAQDRPAAASSTEAVMRADGTTTLTDHYAAGNATDGDGLTRWSSLRSDPQWLRVDLGSSQRIGRVRLSWEVAYGKAYEVQTSEDGGTWTTIYSTAVGDGGVDDLTGLVGSGRFLRLSLTQRGTVYGYSLYGVEVYR